MPVQVPDPPVQVVPAVSESAVPEAGSGVSESAVPEAGSGVSDQGWREWYAVSDDSETNPWQWFRPRGEGEPGWVWAPPSPPPIPVPWEPIPPPGMRGLGYGCPALHTMLNNGDWDLAHTYVVEEGCDARAAPGL